MKIIRLEAENVKRLRAIRIEPDGTMVVVGGRNGAGKSSVLDSIAYALGGKALCPSRPIRDGEKGARVCVDLGEFVVERTWTEKGSYLKVKNADGFEAPSGQALLDKLAGRLAFDPLAFVEMAPREQVEALRDLVGLDFGELDTERDGLYRDRTVVGRDVKRIEGQLAGMPEVEDPGGPVSVQALMAELKEAQVHNAKGDALSRAWDCSAAVGRQLTTEIADLELRLRCAREELDASRAKSKADADAFEAFEAVDTDAIEQQIADADAINQRRRQAVQRGVVSDQLAESRGAYQRMTALIDALDEQKRQALAGAAFPVEGLSFDEERVLFNGLPFEQASSAEQLRVSVAMAIAANPELRVLLIRDGSLLDADNLRLIAKMAEEADSQVWIERVGDGAEVTVLIEDGEVVADSGEQPRLLDVTQ